jgi:hypothetical protein
MAGQPEVDISSRCTKVYAKNLLTEWITEELINRNGYVGVGIVYTLMVGWGQFRFCLYLSKHIMSSGSRNSCRRRMEFISHNESIHGGYMQHHEQ